MAGVGEKGQSTGTQESHPEETFHMAAVREFVQDVQLPQVNLHHVTTN